MNSQKIYAPQNGGSGGTRSPPAKFGLFSYTGKKPLQCFPRCRYAGLDVQTARKMSNSQKSPGWLQFGRKFVRIDRSAFSFEKVFHATRLKKMTSKCFSRELLFEYLSLYSNDTVVASRYERWAIRRELHIIDCCCSETTKSISRQLLRIIVCILHLVYLFFFYIF